MTQSEAWMTQVRSDYEAGIAVFTAGSPSTYCQSISKYQQVVEKSVKAMVAVLQENGVEIVDTGWDHYPERQITALRFIRRAVRQELVNSIQAVFSGHRLGEIRALCLLAPVRPPRRNTEYPFPDGQGWMAPAAEGSFTMAEVYRFRSLASGLVPIVGRFVQAVRLGPK